MIPKSRINSRGVTRANSTTAAPRSAPRRRHPMAAMELLALDDRRHITRPAGDEPGGTERRPDTKSATRGGGSANERRAKEQRVRVLAGSDQADGTVGETRRRDRRSVQPEHGLEVGVGVVGQLADDHAAVD